LKSCHAKKKKKKKRATHINMQTSGKRKIPKSERNDSIVLKSHHPEIQHHALYNGRLLTCIPRFHILEPLLEDSRIMSPEDHGLQQLLCIEKDLQTTASI
jgi:hypothetical protein